MFNLALLYLKDKPPNTKEATCFLHAAAQRGMRDAAALLKELESGEIDSISASSDSDSDSSNSAGTNSSNSRSSVGSSSESLLVYDSESSSASFEEEFPTDEDA